MQSERARTSSEQRGTSAQQNSVSLREQYAALTQRVIENSEAMQDPTNKGISEVIVEANRLQGSVKTTQDASYDANLIRVISNSSLKQVSQINTVAAGVDIESFVQRLKEEMNNPKTRKEEEDGWKRVATFDLGTWRKVPRLDAVLGTIELGLDERVLAARNAEMREREEQRQLRRQQALAQQRELGHRETEKTRATDVSELAPDEDLNTDQLVKKVMSSLKRAAGRSEEGRVPFWVFVTNPESFGESVENLFYTSFLIREGKAKLEVIGGVLYISPVSSDSAKKDGKMATQQTVATFNYIAWKELSEAHKGEDPMITRPGH